MNKILITILIIGSIFIVVAGIVNITKLFRGERGIISDETTPIKINENQNFYEKVKYLKIDAASTMKEPKGINLFVRYYDKDNNLFSFTNLKIPAKIRLFGETAVGLDESKNKANVEKIVLYEKNYLITESKQILKPFLFIPKEEIKYYTDTIYGSVEIIKPDGVIIKEEHTGFIGGKMIFTDEDNTAKKATPSIDIKGNQSDGPIEVSNNSSFQFTWQSSNVKNCVLVGPGYNFAAGFYTNDNKEFSPLFLPSSDSEKLFVRYIKSFNPIEIEDINEHFPIVLIIQCEDFGGRIIEDSLKIFLK